MIDITNPRVGDERGLSVGQRVRAHGKRWTPEGWESVVDIGTVVDPCVQNDPDFTGDVEITIEGVLNRTFCPRASIEPVDAPPTPTGDIRYGR